MSTSMSLGVSSRISSSSEPSTTVGHVPREISKLCCACLGRKEEGSLALTGPRHCSTITEGGLDVPFAHVLSRVDQSPSPKSRTFLFCSDVYVRVYNGGEGALTCASSSITSLCFYISF